MSPASDLPGFIDDVMKTAAGPIFGGYIIRAYSNTYEDVDVDEYVRPGARFSQDKLVERCLSEPSIVVSVLSAVINEPFTDTDVHEGPLYARLQENVPAEPPGVPLFLGQGLSDPLILPRAQKGYVQEMCDAGQVVEFYTYVGLDHMGVVAEDSPMIDDLVTWSIARFVGDPPPITCSTTAH